MLRVPASQALPSLVKVVVTRNLNANLILKKNLHLTPSLQALSKFTMPAMSPTMTEGGISSWNKKEGESFAPGDVLLEIETDKATMDVEAQDEGKLIKIIVGDGSKNVPVGKAIAILCEEGDEIDSSEVEKLVSEAESETPASSPSESKEESTKEESSAPPAKEEPKEEKKSAPKEESKPKSSVEDKPKDVIFASPIVKRIALEKGIALSQIKGSGPNGRIILKDIENYSSSASTSTSLPTTAPPSVPGGPPPQDAAVPTYTDIPLSSMRKVIASRLLESKQTVPHYYLTSEINMERLIKLRQVFNTASAAGGRDGVKAGVKLSVNDFIVKACAIALREIPECNAAFLGDKIRQYSRSDISVAVATPTGLITPIVQDVDSKGLIEISNKIKELAKKAKDGKLQPKEYQGGTFTISNLGMFGSVHDFTAIINPPQSAILAIGGTDKKLVLDVESEKGFKEISVMKVTLSSDHRVIDGALAAQWMKVFKDTMENPLSFLL